MQTAPIIEKWYKLLKFDSKYDAEFYEALNTIHIPAETCIADYDFNCTDGKKNLLSYLYMGEALQEKYAEHGISEEILLDTLSDIARWCDEWSEIKGELYLGEIGWLSRSMNFYLFKIGRLQYCIHNVTERFTQFGMKLGECFIGVHIPPTGPLRIEEVERSLDMARAFFARYFPEMKYTYFSCLSWLLDETLQEYLPAESNILKFATMFKVVEAQPSDDVIRYVFGPTAKRENLQTWKCSSSFAQRIQAAIAEGKIFYETRGLIAR